MIFIRLAVGFRGDYQQAAVSRLYAPEARDHPAVRLTGLAELGELQTYPSGACLVMAQGEKDNLVATVLVEVAGQKIQRFDMCQIPPPQSAKRTGEYPK